MSPMNDTTSAALSVVVGTDGGEHSDPALRFAAHEAALRGVQLVVVIAHLRPVDPDIDSYDIPESELCRVSQEKASRALSRALGLPAERLPPHRIITGSGDPSALLLKTEGAQLIVVGLYHRHLLDRLIHGPVRAAALVRHTGVPVAIVPYVATADK
jgi:nucleotide-binding universal stress UspA family protein